MKRAREESESKLREVERLKLCPFCGGEPDVFVRNGFAVRIECSECGARTEQVSGEIEAAKDYAAKKWNQRTSASRSYDHEPPFVLENALLDARNQIEYLQQKFYETGSGNQIIKRINSLVRRRT